jgi:hypothetical protein
VLVEDPTVDDVTLVTGDDWKGVRGEPDPAAPPSTSSTTLPRVTTTQPETTTATVVGTVSGEIPDDLVCD